MGGAESSRPPVKVPRGRGGDEVVGLSRLELQTTWSRTKRSERNGKILECSGFITYCNNLRSRIGNPARDILLLTHGVDNMLLTRVGADQVHLIVICSHVPTVHVQDVVRIVDPEHGVGRVPVNKMCFAGDKDRLEKD